MVISLPVLDWGWSEKYKILILIKLFWKSKPTRVTLEFPVVVAICDGAAEFSEFNSWTSIHLLKKVHSAIVLYSSLSTLQMLTAFAPESCEELHHHVPSVCQHSHECTHLTHLATEYYYMWLTWIWKDATKFMWSKVQQPQPMFLLTFVFFTVRYSQQPKSAVYNHCNLKRGNSQSDH